jgi:microcystin-dependent protein
VARVQKGALTNYSDVTEVGSYSQTTSSSGNGHPHSIMQPYMALNYIIKY